MNGRDDPDYREAEQERRRTGQDRLRVLPERHGRERHRRGEPDSDREPARQKPDCGAVHAREKTVLAAGARKHRGELGVADRPAERDNAADEPQQKQREAGRDARHLKSETGEDADADHVGHDEGRRRRC